MVRFPWWGDGGFVLGVFESKQESPTYKKIPDYDFDVVGSDFLHVRHSDCARPVRDVSISIYDGWIVDCSVRCGSGEYSDTERSETSKLVYGALSPERGVIGAWLTVRN